MQRNQSLFSLIIVVILVLFLNSCGVADRGSSYSSGLSGKEGISMRFVENSPPSVMYYYPSLNEKQSIEIEAFNKGAVKTDVEGHFAGFDSTLVAVGNGDSASFSFQEEDDKKTSFNPEGGYATQSYEMTMQATLNEVDSYDFGLNLVFCYDYETLARIPICIDPDPTRNVREDACTPSSVSTNGQGAPVSIDSIDVESMPDRVRLKINIKDHSGGDVIGTGTECKGKIPREELGKMDFKNVMLGSIPGNCLVSTPTRLRDGQTTIICTFDLSSITSKSAFKTIFKMDLSYRIKDSIEKNIKIINENVNLGS